jgi:hypothetical protein
MAKDIVDIAERASESKKKVGRSVSINGVHAIDVDVTKSENLEDPLLDVNLRINNPIGRLWLALKRIWKSQNTVINIKFTIPLLVLPLVIYLGYRLWQGRGVNQPMSKLGMIHEVRVASESHDILVLPTSDVYMLEYDTDFDSSHRLVEKPVVVIGIYHNLNNTLSVEDVLAYNPLDVTPSSVPASAEPSMWERIWGFLTQFK